MANGGMQKNEMENKFLTNDMGAWDAKEKRYSGEVIHLARKNRK